MDTGGGFYFIATILDMKLKLPVEITPTLYLDKASSEQRKLIIELLHSDKMGLSLASKSYYEANLVSEPAPNQNSYRYVQLPEDQWRYYVINYPGFSNIEIHNLFLVADLVFPHICSYSHGRTSEPYGAGDSTGWGNDNIGTQSFYGKIMASSKPLEFNEQSLENLKRIFLKYNSLDRSKHEGILRAVELNGNIKRLSNINNLPILAFFMIIEMLLTHKPNDKELGDSLSHQIKTKIALLHSRLRQPLDYSAFGGIKPENVWSKLYTYRSKIAHGDHIDFVSGELSPLKNQEVAYEFLCNAIRSLLAHAMEEPDLINSLKPI